jgi:hypothetical protein
LVSRPHLHLHAHYYEPGSVGQPNIAHQIILLVLDQLSAEILVTFPALFISNSWFIVIEGLLLQMDSNAPGPGLRHEVLVPVDRPNPGRHNCPDCQEEKISPGGQLVLRSSPTRTHPWIYTLKHSAAEIPAAASRGCPFFKWLNRELVRSETPPDQLQRTKIVLEFETGDASNTPIEDSIRSVVVRVSTLNYSWPSGRFDVISSHGISSPLPVSRSMYRFPNSCL